MSAAAEVEIRGESTSPGLSSPPSPNSPTNPTSTPTSLPQLSAASFAQNRSSDVVVEEEKAGKIKVAKKTPTSGSRNPRRKKDPEIGLSNNNNNGNASTTLPSDGQEPKVRKRAPRGTSEAYKKKQAKKEEEARAREAEALKARFSESLPDASLPPPAYSVPAVHTPHQNGNNEAIHTPRLNIQNPNSQSRPGSGQNYDPVRSSTLIPQSNSPMASVSTPHKPYNHSSATVSPSVYGIIDRPNHPYQFPQMPKRESDGKAASPPESKRPRLSPPMPVPTQQSANSTPREIAPTLPDLPTSTISNAMELDKDAAAPISNSNTIAIKKPSPKTSTAVSSSSHSPKPGRPKETSVAMPSGSGLLSGTIFGSGYDTTGPEKTAPTVVLNVPLTSEHQYVNFTRLAEERYGFNALHPRLAAQRERLARVAAAGAALENANKSGGNSGSADDMSVDLSDAEADHSNVEMGGMNDGERNFGVKSGEDTGEAGVVKKPRKRMMKEDMYDKEDDFIDDTELIWEEQAATSKDGFFVYSGPLVPPGQEPTVERYAVLLLQHVRCTNDASRPDGPAKRGRGGTRARGTTRGGRGGAAAAVKDGTKVPGRKARVTKAAKEQMEKEKAQRENLAVLASKPTGYTAPA